MSILGGAPKATLVAPRDRSYARRKARGRMGLSRCARGILVIAFNACCGPIPLRCAYGGSAGSVLRSQEGSGEDWAFALCARSFGVRFQGSLWTDPAPLGVFGAPRDRSCARRKARGRIELSRYARGALVIAFNACSGPIPLRLAYLGGLRGMGPALAEEARGRIGLSRCARGALVIAFNACSGPIPLRLAYLGGLRGIGPALAGRLGEG